MTLGSVCPMRSVQVGTGSIKGFTDMDFIQCANPNKLMLMIIQIW